LRSQTSSRVASRVAGKAFSPRSVAIFSYSAQTAEAPVRRFSLCVRSRGERGRRTRKNAPPYGMADRVICDSPRAIPARESARFEYRRRPGPERVARSVCVWGGGPCLMAGTARLARVSRPHALGLPSHPDHTHSDRAACDERGRTRPPRVAARTVTTPRFRRLTVSKKEATFCRLSCSRPRPLRHTALLG
jgi:hypothetical protein